MQSQIAFILVALGFIATCNAILFTCNPSSGSVGMYKVNTCHIQWNMLDGKKCYRTPECVYRCRQTVNGDYLDLAIGQRAYKKSTSHGVVNSSGTVVKTVKAGYDCICKKANPKYPLIGGAWPPPSLKCKPVY